MEFIKSPKDMANIELLESLCNYTKKVYRSEKEQDYLSELRAETLRRMES